MPWPPKQRTAIYLAVKRRKGARAASALMHKHGYGGSKGPPGRRRRKRRKGPPS